MARTYTFDFCHPTNAPRAAGWWFRLPSLESDPDCEAFEAVFKQVSRRAFRRIMDDPYDIPARQVLEHGVSMGMFTFQRLSGIGGDVLVNRMGGMCSSRATTRVLSRSTESPAWPSSDEGAPKELTIHCYRHLGHYYIGGSEFLCKFDSWDEAYAAASAAFPGVPIHAGGIAQIPLDKGSAIA